MAQHDYVIANQSGAAFRADLNNALAAIVSQNSGASEPSTTYSYQLWADTTAGLLKIRNAANNAWITVGTLADANLGLIPASGGAFTGNVTLNAQNDLRFADSDSSNWVAFQGAATISSNVTWTLPSADGTDGQKLTTNGSGVLSWARSVPNITLLTSGTSATYTPTSGTKAFYVEVIGGGGGGGGVDGQGAGTGALAGAGGGASYAAIMVTDLTQTFTYTVGAGGAGGAAGNNNGSAGGSSTFIGSGATGTLTAPGGGGGFGGLGTASLDDNYGGAGGAVGTGGSLNLAGTRATNGVTDGSAFLSLSIGGHAPTIGGGASNGTANAAGDAASNYGTGGAGGASSASTANYAGGAGGGGLIRITEFF